MAIKGIISLLKKGKAAVDEFYGTKPKQTEVAEEVTMDVDPITQTTLPAISKQEQGLTTLSARGRAEVEDPELVDLYKRQQKVATNSPLSNGDFAMKINQPGGAGDYGSSLYDIVATDPNVKKMPAQYWMNVLNPIKDHGKYKMPGYQNVVRNITRDELEDTNILRFDDSGKAVGGLLKAAADANQSISKQTLFRFIRQNPLNNFNFTIKEFSSKMQDEINDLNKLKVSIYEDVIKLGQTKPEVLKKAKIAPDYLDAGLADAQKYSSSSNYSVAAQGVKIGDLTNFSKGSPLVAGIRNLAEKGFSKDVPSDLPNKIKAYQQANKEVEEMLRRSNTQIPGYAHQGSYRITGSDHYVETFVDIDKLPRDLPGVGHSGLGIKNTIGHARYSINNMLNPTTNQVDDKKVALIGEIQSDISKQFRNLVAEQKKRVMPMGKQEINAILDEAADDVAQNQKKLQDFITDPQNFYKLDPQKIRKEVTDAKARVETFQAMKDANVSNRESYDYMPLITGGKKDRENYARFFVKGIIKQAPKLDEKVEWIAGQPTTLAMATKMSDRSFGPKLQGLVGDFEFYGTPTGKMGMKGVKAAIKNPPEGVDRAVQTNEKADSIMAKVFKEIAKQYDTEYKLIKVAKSNPAKPYKIISKLNNQHMLYDKDDDVSVEAAFRTASEAQEYFQRYSFGRGATVERMDPGDSRNYFTTYAIKINDNLRNSRFKLYKKTGGLVVDIFKW